MSVFENLFLISLPQQNNPAMVYLFGPAPYPGMHSEEILNVTYNLADLVNKGAFGMCVWAAARGAVPDNAQPLL